MGQPARSETASGVWRATVGERERITPLSVAAACAEVDNEYMAGDPILVAPLFAGETSRKVVLPAGMWHDFETAERFEGGRTIQVAPGLDRMPVLIRDGGIVPMMPAMPHVPQGGQPVPIEFRHYGTASGTFRMFDDDGETFACEKGRHRWMCLAVRIGADGARHGEVSAPQTDWPSSYGPITWRFMGQPLARIPRLRLGQARTPTAGAGQ